MGSDSMAANANALIQSVPKDLGNKKKRANRNAKLKQCKMDVRREQWLSQVGKNKGGCKEERNRDHKSPAESNRDLEPLEVKQSGVGEMDLHEHHHEYSDLDSFSSSPTRASSVSDKDMGSNFTGSSSSSSSSSSSGGCFSGNITEAEEDDEEGDGCLDDWEAMADALEADDKEKTPNFDQVAEQEPLVKTDYCCKNTSDSSLGLLGSKPDTVTRRQGSTQAWRRDDASRPHSLPKQLSLPNSDGYPKPPCPICYEELDKTELDFFPCLCGFRLCLFCHKRILEEDGRCPGCRKPYVKNHIESEANVTFRFGRSCSMITRS